MGQGAESCGAYESEYDPYEEGLTTEVWTCRDGTSIKVSAMTENHLRGARRVAQRAAKTAPFTSDAEVFEHWVDVFDDELRRRFSANKEKKAAPKATTKAPRGAMVTMTCWCGRPYQARIADLRRGWAMTCSKSHAAVRRAYGKPLPKEKDTGRTVAQILNDGKE